MSFFQGPTIATKSTELIQRTKLTKPTKLTRPTRPTRLTKPIKQTKPTKPNQPNVPNQHEVQLKVTFVKTLDPWVRCAFDDVFLIFHNLHNSHMYFFCWPVSEAMLISVCLCRICEKIYRIICLRQSILVMRTLDLNNS